MANRKSRAFDGLAEALANRAEAEGAADQPAIGRVATPRARRIAGFGAVTREHTSGVRDGEVLVIPVSSIRPNPRNYFRAYAIQELADEILVDGLLHPLVVRHAPDGETDYELISGERRWRALSLLSEREGSERAAAATVRLMDDAAAERAMITSNTGSREITAGEWIESIKRLEPIIEQERRVGTVRGKTFDLLAQALTLSPAQVRRYQALASAVPDLVTAVDDELLTLRSAVDLAARAPEIQTVALDELRSSYDGRKHTEAEAAAIVARVAKPAPKKRPASAGPVERVEKSLRSSLMTLKRVVAIEDAKRHAIAALAREIITLVEEGTEG